MRKECKTNDLRGSRSLNNTTFQLFTHLRLSNNPDQTTINDSCIRRTPKKYNLLCFINKADYINKGVGSRSHLGAERCLRTPPGGGSPLENFGIFGGP